MAIINTLPASNLRKPLLTKAEKESIKQGKKALAIKEKKALAIKEKRREAKEKNRTIWKNIVAKGIDKKINSIPKRFKSDTTEGAQGILEFIFCETGKIVLTPINNSPGTDPMSAPITYLALLNYIKESVNFTKGNNYAWWDEDCRLTTEVGDLFGFVQFQSSKCSMDLIEIFRVLEINSEGLKEIDTTIESNITAERRDFLIVEHKPRKAIVLSKCLGIVKFSDFVVASENHKNGIKRGPQGTFRYNYPSGLLVNVL